MYDFAGSFERTISERTSSAAHTEAVNIFVNIDRDLLLPTVITFSPDSSLTALIWFLTYAGSTYLVSTFDNPAG